MKIIYIIGALAVIAFISLIPFDVKYVSPQQISDMPNAPDEIRPDAEGANTHFIHWHARLDIFINGKSLAIPSNVGIIGNDHAVIHTHEADNVLHIEQFPNKTTMTAGYFFEIWSYQINKSVVFNSSCILDMCNDKDHAVVFIVNGEKNSDYENYVMKDEDILKIEYKKRSNILQAN